MRWETFWLCALFTLLVSTLVAAKVRTAQQEQSVIVKGINVLRVQAPTNLAIKSGPPTGGGPLFQVLPRRVAVGMTDAANAVLGADGTGTVATAKARMIEAPTGLIAKPARPARTKLARADAKKNNSAVEPASSRRLFGQALAPVEGEPDASAAFDTRPAGRHGSRSNSLGSPGFAPEIEPSPGARSHVAIPLGERTALTVGSATSLWSSNKVVETRSQSLNDPTLTDRLGREEDEAVFSGAAVGFRFKLN